MLAAVLHAPGDVRIENVEDPVIRKSTDALVRVVATSVCGSDLWPYRGNPAPPAPQRIGHEFVGVVEEVGTEVRGLRPGVFVLAPFMYCDNSCAHCRLGMTSNCELGGGWGRPDRAGDPVDAGQGQYVRVPLADGTLVPTPCLPGHEQIADLLTLTDVMGTGHHAAKSANVGPGRSVVVVGDGAVAICAVLAAHRLGADQIIIMSRNPARQKLARIAGATDVVGLRGQEGIQAVLDRLGGVGADSVLECVGTNESMEQAIGAVRPGGHIGYVGVPHGSELPIGRLFWSNVHIAGGPAPIRAYLPELLSDVLDGNLAPGFVFDEKLPLERIKDAYAAMDERRSLKVMLTP